jgi:hypothetical protein
MPDLTVLALSRSGLPIVTVRPALFDMLLITAVDPTKLVDGGRHLKDGVP